MNGAMRTAGDEGGARGCGAALTIEAVARVSKGWKKRVGELESWKYKPVGNEGKKEKAGRS